MLKIAKDANVPVILDVGGADTPLPSDLLQCITVLSPNETELARLTCAQVESLEDAINAAKKCQEMVTHHKIEFSSVFYSRFNG